MSPQVEEAFGFAEATAVSYPDLYADKIVAALDQQHPRDLFDVWELFAHEGVGAALRQAFLVYLVSHDRPIAEVIAPRLKDLTRAFAQGFEGMTLEPVALDELLTAQEALIATMVGGMPDTHRQSAGGRGGGQTVRTACARVARQCFYGPKALIAAHLAANAQELAAVVSISAPIFGDGTATNRPFLHISIMKKGRAGSAQRGKEWPELLLWSERH